MRSAIRELASRQDGLVGRWQLATEEDALKCARADWALRDLRRVFPGVCITGWGPLTQRQIWRAATLTAPDTALHVASAAGLLGMRPDPGRFVTVVRPGNRGANRSGRLRVAYSTTLEPDLTVADGIPTTTAERTLVDLWPHLHAHDRSKMLREALRLGLTTAPALLSALHRHRRRLGATALRTEVLARIDLPFDRCKSDGEAFGLVVLQDAGVPIPEVNARFAGEEADFCWPDLRHIIEIDGPQWHRFKEEDARKTATWVAAGFRVDRIPSDLVFAEPQELLRLAPPPRV